MALEFDIKHVCFIQDGKYSMRLKVRSIRHPREYRIMKVLRKSPEHKEGHWHVQTETGVEAKAHEEVRFTAHKWTFILPKGTNY